MEIAAKHRGYCHLGRHWFAEDTPIIRRGGRWVCKQCCDPEQRDRALRRRNRTGLAK